VVDDEDVNRPFGGVESESELFSQRGRESDTKRRNRFPPVLVIDRIERPTEN